MNSPNMAPEVIEAIHLMYEDSPELEADCYLYLSNLYKYYERVEELQDYAVNAIETMGRCPDCGELLQEYYYKEPHPELDGCPMEEMTEVYCPNCDMPGQIKMEDWR